MKIGYILFFGIGAVLPAWGSPISVPIDSMEMLDQLKIRIEHEEFDGIPNDGLVVSVKVTWNPVQEDKDFPPRFDLILFRPTEPSEPSERRMWVRTSPNADGLCISEFSVSKSEAGHTQLIFWNGQNLVHGFSLSDFLAGFAEPELGFGSTLPSKPNKRAKSGRNGD